MSDRRGYNTAEGSNSAETASHRRRSQSNSSGLETEIRMVAPLQLRSSRKDKTRGALRIGRQSLSPQTVDSESLAAEETTRESDPENVVETEISEVEVIATQDSDETASGSARIAEASKMEAATKTEMAMSERLSSLAPGTRRYDALSCALDFKRSWVRLAKYLTEIKESRLFKEWGYRTFEAYAKHELHLKRDTATKLVRSYDFLNQHEKPVLQAAEGTTQTTEEPVDLPSYQALDILAEARQNPQLPEREYRELRDQVFREDLPPATLKKMVKEMAPEPAKAVATDPQEQLRKALRLAERLYGLLLEEQVPDSVQRAAEEVVGGLRRLIDE